MMKLICNVCKTNLLKQMLPDEQKGLSQANSKAMKLDERFIFLYASSVISEDKKIKKTK